MKLSGTGQVSVVLSTVSLVGLLPDANQSVHNLRNADVNLAFTAAGSLLLIILSGWLLAGVALSFLAVHVTACTRVARTITPAFLRTALFLGAAGALAVGPAWASDSVNPGLPSPHTVTAVSVLDGLQLPDRPTASLSTLRPVGPHRPGSVHTERHTVAPGETLWAIAAATLAPSATAGEIVHAVNRWHEANRDVIGADPNRLFPGQELNPPK